MKVHHDGVVISIDEAFVGAINSSSEKSSVFILGVFAPAKKLDNSTKK